jgi:hypothetical protein
MFEELRAAERSAGRGRESKAAMKHIHIFYTQTAKWRQLSEMQTRTNICFG